MELKDITTIVTLLVQLFVAIAVTFVIPWLKSKTDDQQRQKTLQYIDIAVSAAEQLAKAEGWDGETKKSWVISYLEGLGFTIDYDEADAMIEAAVLKLHEELK